MYSQNNRFADGALAANKRLRVEAADLRAQAKPLRRSYRPHRFPQLALTCGTTVTLRAFVGVFLAIVLACLTPLADASPVDPTWVAGFWDNGDFDDVVLFICDMAADLPAPPTPPSGTNEVIERTHLSEPAKPALAAVASALSRAPPRI